MLTISICPNQINPLIKSFLAKGGLQTMQTNSYLLCDLYLRCRYMYFCHIVNTRLLVYGVLFPARSDSSFPNTTNRTDVLLCTPNSQCSHVERIRVYTVYYCSCPWTLILDEHGTHLWQICILNKKIHWLGFAYDCPWGVWRRGLTTCF